MAKNSDSKELNIDELQQIERNKTKVQETLSDEFVTEHMPVIEAIASNIAGRGSLPTGVEFDDLVSWGVEGLIKAHKNYNPDKGTVFKTYAYYRIRGEIYDKIRQEWHYRNPSDYNAHRKRMQERIAEVVEDILEGGDNREIAGIEATVGDIISNSAMVCLLSLDGIEEVEGANDPAMEDPDSKNSILWEEINELEPEEKKIIELFYVQGLKQKEIADQLDYSKSKICRMHMKVLEKLKRRLKRRMDE